MYFIACPRFTIENDTPMNIIRYVSIKIPADIYLKFSLISIRSHDNQKMNIRNKHKYNDILPLVFDDLDEPYTMEDGTEMIIFNENQADKIIEFYNKEVENKVSIFIVHCDAGVSRSVAVISALAKYYDGTIDTLAKGNQSVMNRKVYSTIIERLNLDKNMDIMSK